MPRPTAPGRRFGGKRPRAALPLAGLAPDEVHAFDQHKDFYTKHPGYASEMANRPQTLCRVDGFALLALRRGFSITTRDSYEMIAPSLFREPWKSFARRRPR